MFKQVVKNIRLLYRHRSSFTGKVGDKVTVMRKITDKDIEDFIKLSGDDNPIHRRRNDVDDVVVHGAFLNSLVSGVIGTKLPGNGCILLSQTLMYPNKCYVNEEVKITVELKENRKISSVKFFCEVDKRMVLYGDARVLIK